MKVVLSSFNFIFNAVCILCFYSCIPDGGFFFQLPHIFRNVWWPHRASTWMVSHVPYCYDFRSTCLISQSLPLGGIVTWLLSTPKFSSSLVQYCTISLIHSLLLLPLVSVIFHSKVESSSDVKWSQYRIKFSWQFTILVGRGAIGQVLSWEKKDTVKGHFVVGRILRVGR